MADKGPPQKTQLLTDAPPEVQKAIDRQSQGGGGGGGGAPRTVLMDAPQTPAAQPQGGARPMANPTMMQKPGATSLPPVARKTSSAGRWIAGPILSMVIAAGTAFGARFVLPPPAKPAPVAKAKGKLMLETEPASASVTIDGKPFPRFTPTEVEGEVGSTMRVGFKLDGYESKEEEVAVMAGQKTFKVTLEKSAPPAPAPVAAAPAPEPKEKRRSSSKEPAAPKEPAGKGTLSVFVRPWAIVYIDGSRLRQTPVQGYELPSGKHTIELVNDPKGKKEKMQITLKPGESQEIRKDWDK